MFVFVDHNRCDVGRSQSSDNELRRIFRPQDDIDAFTAQFTGNGLNAGTAHADTGTDRINSLVAGEYRYFRTNARVTCS